MWVAIAAVTFTSLSRAESGLQHSKTCAHPVLELLARSQVQNPAAHSGVLRYAHTGSGRQAGSMLRHPASAALIAMLPVLFIGLVLPLSVASIRSLGRAPAAPLLPALFQRPPPCLA
jgi:hypothetical protein